MFWAEEPYIERIGSKQQEPDGRRVLHSTLDPVPEPASAIALIEELSLVDNKKSGQALLEVLNRAGGSCSPVGFLPLVLCFSGGELCACADTARAYQALHCAAPVLSLEHRGEGMRWKEECADTVDRLDIVGLQHTDAGLASLRGSAE